MIGLIGQPYSKDFNCWTVIEKYHHIDVSVPEDILISGKAKVCFINDMKMMFTKLDETMGFGNIFSLAYETKKPISYFSIGQEVPEDLVCASGDFLVNCLLNGFDRDKV